MRSRPSKWWRENQPSETSAKPSRTFRPVDSRDLKSFTLVHLQHSTLRIPDRERFYKQTMVVLLRIEGKCSHLRAKPAHLVSHLPSTWQEFPVGMVLVWV